MKKRFLFSHVKDGAPGMVDISHKAPTVREARAESIILLPKSLWALLEQNELHLPKGPVLSTAIVAGTMAAKNTAMLIPFCHSLDLSGIKITIEPWPPNQLKIACLVKTTGSTGVEMEALTGASIAALTIYDMCKAVSSDMVICETRLVQKSGGRRDFDKQRNERLDFTGGQEFAHGPAESPFAGVGAAPVAPRPRGAG